VNGGVSLTVGGEFDGIGLLALGLHLAGLRHAWLCEVDPWRRFILELRFPGVPVFDDVRAVGAANARPVDVIAGGFPCKGVSGAGTKSGFGHPETALWREMLRTVRELRPRYVLVENVADLLRLRPPGGQPGDLFREVLGGLSALGFDVVWDCLPAASVGAPHRRDRVFAVASHPDGAEERRHGGELGEQGGRPDAGGEREAPADSTRNAEGGAGTTAWAERQRARIRRGVPVDWGEYGGAIRRWERVAGRAPEPLVRRVDDGCTRRVERSRLSALGDGVQVQVGYLAGRHIVELERRRVGT
jgi:DNA (cytosine-5)-methyltransferase 1